MSTFGPALWPRGDCIPFRGCRTKRTCCVACRAVHNNPIKRARSFYGSASCHVSCSSRMPMSCTWRAMFGKTICCHPRDNDDLLPFTFFALFASLSSCGVPLSSAFLYFPTQIYGYVYTMFISFAPFSVVVVASENLQRSSLATAMGVFCLFVGCLVRWTVGSLTNLPVGCRVGS
jgi:hypothetical protein